MKTPLPGPLHPEREAPPPPKFPRGAGRCPSEATADTGPPLGQPLCWAAAAREAGMGGVNHTSQSRRHTTPVLLSEGALQGWEGAGLGPPSEQNDSFPEMPSPHPVLAHTVAAPKTYWARRRRPRHQGLGLTTSLTFWNPSPCSVSCTSPTQQQLHNDPCRTTCVLGGGLLQGGVPRGPGQAPKSTRHPHPGGVRFLRPSAYTPSRLVPARVLAGEGWRGQRRSSAPGIN